jgi:hypothetical protein
MTSTIHTNERHDATQEVDAIIPKPKNSRHNARVVLANLAQIIIQIVNLIKNPHNTEKIGTSMTGITSSIANITINALEQNKNINLNDETALREYLHDFYQDFNPELAAMIIDKSIFSERE